MKISVKNSNFFKENKSKLKRIAKRGIVTAALVIGIPYFIFTTKKKNNDIDNQFFQPVIEDPVEATLDDINSMNIIINDNDCSDSFIEEIYNELESDGIKITGTNNDKDINYDNSIVITLDQQYMAGPDMLVIAPYDNNRIGNSDALALACERAFDENGFFVEGIESGIRGYEETDEGVTERIATNEEKIINSNYNTSFVTISFGTTNTNAHLVVSSIENALTRYNYYINNSNIGEDLLYRTGNEDTLESLALKYNTTVNYLKVMNDIIDDELPKDSIIKNPIVENLREFKSNVPMELKDVEKTLWSK